MSPVSSFVFDQGYPQSIFRSIHQAWIRVSLGLRDSRSFSTFSFSSLGRLTFRKPSFRMTIESRILWSVGSSLCHTTESTLFAHQILHCQILRHPDLVFPGFPKFVGLICFKIFNQIDRGDALTVTSGPSPLGP